MAQININTQTYNGVISTYNGVISNSIQGKLVINGSNNIRLYKVDEYQTSNPIRLSNGLILSLESDLLDSDSIKKNIIDELAEKYPESYLKLGCPNPSEIDICTIFTH